MWITVRPRRTVTGLTSGTGDASRVSVAMSSTRTRRAVGLAERDSHAGFSNGETDMSVKAKESAGSAGIRPFTIEMPESDLEELRRRIEATRWPTKELFDDRSQGVQLAAMQALARYWAS